GGDIPFSDGQVWIWTSGRTNYHDYLYDLDHGAVLGEVFNAGAVFANQDQSKLLCKGSDSPIVSRKGKLLLLLNQLSMGKTPLLPANKVETFWILDLKHNLARRIGDVSQWPRAGSRWHQSPGFRYGYTVPSTAQTDAEFVLCDLDQAAFRKIKFAGRLQGWWDDHQILAKDPADNFVLLDITTGKTATLFTATTFANTLQQLGLATNLAPVIAFPNWNGHAFDFYFNAPTNRVAGNSYLLKADRTDNTLKLVSRDFEFKWGGRLDATGSHYLYDGESGAPGRGGNGGVYLRDLTDNTTRTIVPPDNKGQYAISRFYKESVIYCTNRLIWRIDLSGSNNTQILPAAGK
ncbi:MAG: hypothetical protein JWR69_627, partial [Pedosphaera sp.]|nr:hypothetical protein [Pedosphaera sp.]